MTSDLTTKAAEIRAGLVERLRDDRHCNDWYLRQEAAALIEQQAAELAEARGIVRDIYWMALRYADGRQTYAPGMCNDALRKAYDGGWLVHRHQNDPAFARDGASPEYRSLEARATTAEAERDSWRRVCERLETEKQAALAERDELLREKERMGAALGKVKHWAESRCPCHNEEPNPCPLCGASVENLEACKSAENTLPRDVLEAVRRASPPAALAPLGEAGR